MLDEAIRRIDKIYQGALAQGLLKPDPTLVSSDMALDQVMADLRRRLLAEENPQGQAGDAAGQAASGDSTASAPDQTLVAMYTVQFASPDAASVDLALAAVRGGPGVQSASTTSIAIGGTSVMRVSMTGSLDALAGHLRSQGWQVSAGSNVIRIGR